MREKTFLHQNLKSSKLAFFRQFGGYYITIGFGALVLESFSKILAAVLPFFTKLQVDQLQANPLRWPWLGSLSQWQVFLVLLAIPLVLDTFRSWLTTWFETSVNTRTRQRLETISERLIWDKLKSFDAGYFENQRNQVILEAGLDGSRTVYGFFRFGRDLFGSVVGVMTIIPIFGLVSWQLLALVVTASILQIVLQRSMQMLSRVDRLALNFIESKTWRVHHAIKYHYYTLRTYQIIDSMIDRYQELVHQRNTVEVQTQQSRDKLSLVEFALNQSLSLGVQAYVGWQVLEGSLSIGTFTMVVAYAVQLNSLFSVLFSRWSEWQELDLNHSKLQFFLNMTGRLKQSEKPTALSNQEKLALSVDDVSFRYPDYSQNERAFFEFMVQKLKVAIHGLKWTWLKSELQDWQELLKEHTRPPEVIQHVSLEFRSGETVALLGRNGAGKTTLTRLLLHHFEPEAGQVVLNGVPIWQLDPDQYFGLFGWLQQQPFILWQFTVRDNLLLGVTQAVSDDELWTWLKKVNLYQVIHDLPKGLDTILGEDTTLSGGQQQLLALLRVLLQQRPILIFDEGSSQLDVERETAVLELIKSQADKALVIFITHRITTARKADRIVVLDAGQVAEQGTHAQLLKKPRGLYRKWWQMQVGG